MFLYSGFLVYFFEFSIKTVGGGPTCQSLLWFATLTLRDALQARSKKRCACAKKSNQKKAHNLTKIDPDITYSLWDGFIQYTLATPTKTFFTRLSCSSISKLASSQYHSDPSDFSKHNEATTNKFSRLLFILEQVKTVPNGRLLLLSSACRSKKIIEEPSREKKSNEEQQLKRIIFYSKKLLSVVWGRWWKSER